MASTWRRPSAMVLDYVRSWVPEARKAPLAGNTVGTDRLFLTRDMPMLEGHLHYRVVDVSSIKELARRWYPRAYFAAPAKGGNHRALADIQESIEELRYYRAAVFVAPPGPDTETARGFAAEHGGLDLAAPRTRGVSRPEHPLHFSSRDWPSRACQRATVGVAQLVEHLVVVQVAAGSSPVTHPTSRTAPRPAHRWSGGLPCSATDWPRLPSARQNRFGSSRSDVFRPKPACRC